MCCSLLASGLGGEKPRALCPASLLEHPPSPTVGCAKPRLLTLEARGASSRLDWALPAGRAGWGRGDTELIVTMFLSWFHRGTPSVPSRSLKRRFELAGDPSSSAAAEPLAALGFVPSAAAMPVALSPIPAHVPVPGCPGVMSRERDGRANAVQDVGETDGAQCNLLAAARLVCGNC